jgi:hypothetical protein
MHRFERERFEDEHIQRALDENAWVVWHKDASLWLPGGAYASPTGCQEEIRYRIGTRTVGEIGHSEAELKIGGPSMSRSQSLKIDIFPKFKFGGGQGAILSKSRRFCGPTEQAALSD